MEIFTKLNYNPNLSLALGYFDGVHTGHKAVIKNAVEYAKQNNTKSAVITFIDHPCCYFWGVCPKYILTREERERKIFELGVDYIYELDFENISHLTAEEYLKDILIENFEPLSISTGHNHNFGAKKSGNTNFLNKMSKEFEYKYFEMPMQELNNKTISSTEIRNLLSNGEILKANEMLGYNYIIRGEVIKGDQIGRKLGFKTANLVYPPELIDLPFGVYSVLVKINEQAYRGVANVGVRPTVSNTNQRVLEVHILDFDKDIYGEIISIEFLNMIRTEQKFNSLEELKIQIQKDISRI